ncbi:hypothetical protein [Streptomyces sp. NPDC050504]
MTADSENRGAQEDLAVALDPLCGLLDGGDFARTVQIAAAMVG